MIPIILFIVLFLYLLMIKKESFDAFKHCHKSLKMNKYELSNQNNILLKINPHPWSDRLPPAGILDLKKITMTCDGRNYTKIGFHPDDIRKIDPELVSQVGGKDYVSNSKLIPLLLNEAKSLEYYRFDNPTFVNNLQSKINSLDREAGPLRKWLKDPNGGDMGGDNDPKASCQRDSQCGGQTSNGAVPQGQIYGKCVGGKCVCSKTNPRLGSRCKTANPEAKKVNLK